MRERKYLVQGFYYGSDDSIELWEQHYFTNYDEAFNYVGIYSLIYDQVTFSKINKIN